MDCSLPQGLMEIINNIFFLWIKNGKDIMSDTKEGEGDTNEPPTNTPADALLHLYIVNIKTGFLKLHLFFYKSMWGRNKTNWYMWHVEVYLFGWPF